MTSPVQSTPGPPMPETAHQPVSPASSITVDVSRAHAAPIYVYRVTETATGRTLIEIPTEQPAVDPLRPGAQLDQTA